jgi:2-keto-4-pentenoate hydratase/2-oxohepta-3-ene-1,7-dioic acid hydratase in catechol pathway
MLPPEPIIFMKATSAICGPNDPIIIPRTSQKTDWEVELAVIIGTKAKYVSQEDALAHVAGYAVTNDVSERAFQTERSGQWTKGKSCDNFGQIGPWLVTRDEVPDPQALEVSCWLNGQQMQHGHTADMLFPVATLIAYLSRFMTLEPGDVITTGTPAGIGAFRSPPVYLQAGDLLRLEVSQVGAMEHRVA